jgi:hypothetical protein
MCRTRARITWNMVPDSSTPSTAQLGASAWRPCRRPARRSRAAAKWTTTCWPWLTQLVVGQQGGRAVVQLDPKSFDLEDELERAAYVGIVVDDKHGFSCGRHGGSLPTGGKLHLDLAQIGRFRSAAAVLQEGHADQVGCRPASWP